MAVQPNINAIVKPSTYPSPKLSLKPLKAPTFVNPKPFSQLKKKNWSFSLSAAPESISDISVVENELDVDDDLPVVTKEVIFFLFLLIFAEFFWVI